MKNMVKKNQIMITALAIMIAVAGYLNFAGSKITEEEIMTAGSGTVMSEDVADSDVAALFEISDEDMEQADIQSMDSDVVLNESNYLDENMEVASYLDKKEGLISMEESSVPVYVIPTNEELMIAMDTYELIK